MPEESDRFAEIAGAIGRLSAGLEEAHRQTQRLEVLIGQGLQRLEVSVKEMLTELRERYHEKATSMQSKMLSIDKDVLALQSRVTKLEFWRTWVLGVAAATGGVMSLIALGVEIWLKHL